MDDTDAAPAATADDFGDRVWLVLAPSAPQAARGAWDVARRPLVHSEGWTRIPSRERVMGIFDGSAIESHFKLCEWMPHAIDEFTVSFAPMAPAKKTLLVLGPEERFVKMAAASASPPAFAAVSDRGRVWSWGNYKANGHVTSTALPGDTIYGWSPFLIREEPRLLRCETDLVPEGDWITGVEAAGRYASFFVFTTEKGAFVRLVANPRCKEDGRDGRIDAKPYVPYVEDDKWIWKFFAKDDPERNGPMPGESEI